MPDNRNCDHTKDERYAIYDGKGIFLAYVCDKCEADTLKRFRPDIMENYDCDEAIEPEEY